MYLENSARLFYRAICWLASNNTYLNIILVIRESHRWIIIENRFQRKVVSRLKRESELSSSRIFELSSTCTWFPFLFLYHCLKLNRFDVGQCQVSGIVIVPFLFAAEFPFHIYLYYIWLIYFYNTYCFPIVPKYNIVFKFKINSKKRSKFLQMKQIKIFHFKFYNFPDENIIWK